MAEYLAVDVQNYLENENKTVQQEIERYFKTSKTENMLGDLIRYMRENEKTSIFILESFRAFFGYRTKYRKRKERIKNMIWVQLYPQGSVSSIFDDDNYSIVRFDEETWSPSWVGTTIDTLVEKTGYSKDSFYIDPEIYNQKITYR